jgi:cytidyltransferase-like protein
MYHHVFVAGTFDGLHKGHIALLMRAFVEGEKVTIGLTSDQFIRRYKSQITNPNDQTKRKKAVDQWLITQGFVDRAKIIFIDNPYEPAASMKELDALIVTRENRKTGERINVLRQGSTLSSLALIEVPMVAAEDGRSISSTRMRNGEIDHNGRLVMPESLRATLGSPLGTVLKGVAVTASIERSCKKTIITVGDIATKTFLDAGIIPTLSIIDGKVGRKPFAEVVNRLRPARSVQSGPGFISREAIEAIRSCLPHQRIGASTHQVLFIDGEEDLLVLPVIIHAPVGALVCYGQPGKGMVEVVITSETKKTAEKLLRQFSIAPFAAAPRAT